MSIRRKLAVILSLLMSSILILNNWLNYIMTEENLIKDQQRQMEAIAQEIRIAIELSEGGKKYTENLLGEHLRTAAVAAQNSLDPVAANITNEQLMEVRDRIGVSHITLFKRMGDDIVGVKSTDEKEINLSTKEWGYWFTAMDQLLTYRNTNIPEGQRLHNYWSGPAEVASSDPTHVDKWGYYHDGTTDYIINTYFRDVHLSEFEELTGPKRILEKTQEQNPTLLEITGFNPNAFGKAPIYTNLNGSQYIEVKNREIQFGTYTYKDEQRDVDSVNQSFRTGEVVSFTTTLSGKQVIKTFLPIYAEKMLVIGLVTDYAFIEEALHEILMSNVLTSILLLLFVSLVCTMLSGYIVRPIRSVIESVSAIASGNLHTRVDVKRTDELGRLADNINLMSQNLQAYTDELKSLFEHNSAAIFQISLRGQILALNPAAEKVTGYGVDELKGRHCLSIVHTDDKSKALRQFESAVQGQSSTYVLRVLHKDGYDVDFGLTDFPIYVNNEIVGLYWIARDISEVRKTEELLRKSDKLAVVGQLAAGVAHEIRNPLTSIKGFVQLIQETTSTKKTYTDIMLSELDRIEFIMNEFLVLAKPQATNYQFKDVNQLLQNILTLVDTQAIIANVLIIPQVHGELPQVLCEENQLKQVFINILKNSIEAMPDGGVITIDLMQVEGNLRLRFVDQGVGIPAERIPKLGEPFYTTKEKGTGLGLMITHKIINEHHGKIRITSEVGVGTTVDVFLPIVNS